MSEALKRKDLRLELIRRRDALNTHQRSTASLILVERLRAQLALRFGSLTALNVGAYLPIGSEPDITSLFGEFGAVSLPQVVSRAQPLRFLAWHEGMALTREDFGILVPKEQIPAQPDVLLVPCVGFFVRADGRVDRLGYGGGFYDRTLAAGRFATLGIAFEVGHIALFDAEPHDVPLDAVVTEVRPAAARASKV